MSEEPKQPPQDAPLFSKIAGVGTALVAVNEVGKLVMAEYECFIKKTPRAGWQKLAEGYGMAAEQSK